MDSHAVEQELLLLPGESEGPQFVLEIMNFTRIGLGAALNSCRRTVEERWACSITGGVGKCSFPIRSGIS